MKNVRSLLLAFIIGLASLTPVVSMAQTIMNASAAMPMAVDGEVRKVDLTVGKIAIKHGMQDAEMPGMTMTYPVKDKALLSKFKAGDKVHFTLSHEDGTMLVTNIQLAK
ncbi:copper-binding protein [Aquitalea pelogenes]|uniref:copper-binding protein n=1 Tax=Aquitalea pelogenes TaxID=1293573 RepID=UPI0035AEC714